MGRYVALAFGLVTLVIAVDTASGRRFGCSASPPDACYTCPMPNFAGGNACEVVAGPVACPTPCASPAYDACDSVSAAVSEPQTAAEPSSDDNEMPPPTEQASSAPDESSTRAAGSLQADPLRQPAASASPAAPAEQEQATNDGPDRYSERLPQATPSTRPLFRSPSNEGLLPTPADQPATRESASSPSNNDDRYGQPTPVLEETPFLDEPTELAPADETHAVDD